MQSDWIFRSENSQTVRWGRTPECRFGNVKIRVFGLLETFNGSLKKSFNIRHGPAYGGRVSKFRSPDIFGTSENALICSGNANVRRPKRLLELAIEASRVVCSHITNEHVYGVGAWTRSSTRSSNRKLLQNERALKKGLRSYPLIRAYPLSHCLESTACCSILQQCCRPYLYTLYTHRAACVLVKQTRFPPLFMLTCTFPLFVACFLYVSRYKTRQTPWKNVFDSSYSLLSQAYQS